MTDPKPREDTPALDEYVDAFGKQFVAAIADEAVAESELRRPAPVRWRDRRRWRFTGIGLATLAAVATAIVLLPILPTPGPKRHDVVTGAQAGFGKPGMILHYVVTQEAHMEGDVTQSTGATGPCKPARNEIWQSTQGPSRFRALEAATDPKCGQIVHDGKLVTGPTEYSSAPGRSATYYPDLHLMTVITGLSGRSQDQLPGLDPTDDSGFRELITGLRDMFRKGRLRELKRGIEGGRKVVYLVGEVRKVSKPRSEHRLKYVVDAATYAPIRLERRTVEHQRRIVEHHRSRAFVTTWVWRFESYEQLPVTTANEKLLTIQPTKPVTVETQTLEEVRATGLRESARRRAEASRRYQRRQAAANK